MYGTPPARNRSSAARVLASCISASVPSCMRAPPDALTTISGTRAASACSAARATFSPTTAPIEPPMNPKSITQIATSVPAIAPVPHRAASRIPVASLGGREPVRVGLLVDEPERVDRLQAGVTLGPRPVIEQMAEPRLGRQAEMVAAGRADPEVLVELLVEQHRRARRTLGPQVGRVDVATRAERRQLERHQTRPRPGDRADGTGHRVGPAAGRGARRRRRRPPATGRPTSARRR